MRPSALLPSRSCWVAGLSAAVLLALLPGGPAAGAQRGTGVSTGTPGPSTASTASTAGTASTGHWTARPGRPGATMDGHRAEIVARNLRDYTLDRAAMARTLDAAPAEGTRAAASAPRVVRIPAPDGSVDRFAVQETSVMQPRLAAAHPGIRTYVGTGIDDPTARLRADLTPLGFHASVLSPSGAWYVDPLYKGDDTVYASYYARDLRQGDADFVERADVASTSEALRDGVGSATADVPAGPEVQLRTYRLALVTDPSYATYFGAANVTAAKVTLVNRVTQIYEDEMAVRLVLVNDTDRTNLNTNALALEPNGPCGAAPCYTTNSAGQSQFAAGCTGGLLSRNRIVLGQLVGARNYDIGHIGLGVNGGGVASLNAVGGNAKAQGCTGLPTPVGDYFAVDYVAHEMGHQFGGNHTFNGTQSNCGGNKAAPSVEPGSGSSIMAYAGICRYDNLQPHSDPYWSQWSFQEITAYMTSSRPAINEVQTASLYGYDAPGDAFALSYDGVTSAPLVRGTSWSAASVQAALQGPSEVQAVALDGYDTDGDSYRLSYGGSPTAPIVRGQNNTAAGIAAALQGGNEQQQVTLTGFNPTTQSFRVQLGGATSGLIGAGGATYNNNGIAAAVNAVPGFAGTVSSAGAGPGGFTLTFGGASAATDVPSASIVDCTCGSAVRETVKGGGAVAGWPAGGTVTVGTVTDAGYSLTFGGSLSGSDLAELAVVDGTGVTGSVTESAKGGPGILPVGASATVAGFGGGTFDDTGFQVTYGGVLGGVDVDMLELVGLTGASGFVGDTAKGGPIDNAGHLVEATGNHAPVVTTPAEYVIPRRTPFALTGTATDSDGDGALTYMWEQKDRGGGAGTALVDNAKVNGPLFRQFGVAARVTPEGTLQTPSPGLNQVGTDPTRVFPDLGQVLSGTTNAATGSCPAVTSVWPTPLEQAVVDCYSEFLPTAAYVGVTGVNAAPASLNFRLTVRDGRPGGGGVGSADTRLVLAPGADPFRVTSQARGAALDAGTVHAVTWDVAGTDVAPVSTAQVRITLSTDGGWTYPHVLAAATANDGSADVEMPAIDSDQVRIKVEAVGNVYFDVSDVTFSVRGIADQLQDLVDRSTGAGPGTSLADKARLARSSYAAGSTAATCQTLADYRAQVRALAGKKQLSDAKATELTVLVDRLRRLIGC